MANEFMRFTYDMKQTDKAEQAPGAILVDGSESPETDLLPDDEFVSNYEPEKSSNALEYDLAVIGSGPAGQTAAIKAARFGAKVIMFEKEMPGGRWLNTGCIPVKAYLKANEGRAADLQKALSNKNEIVSKMASNAARLLRANRVRVEVGEAMLKSPHEIACSGRVYRVSKIIICGGSDIDRSYIPGLDHPGVWGTNDVFQASRVPQRLLILGGGSKGCELAAAFSAFGSNVMLVEQHHRLLPGWDAQIAEAVGKALAEAGVKVHTGITVNEIADRNGNPYLITGRGGVLCDKVVITAGRKPDTSFLGELAREFKMNKGAVAVNEYLETSLSGIYAAGDITGLSSNANAAYYMAKIAAVNATGGKRQLDLKSAPLTIQVSPEVASVGLTEEEAFEKLGDSLVTGYCPLLSNVKAMLTGKPEGFVKVLAGRKHGEIIGVHIVSPNASEMIAEPAALMRMEVTVNEIADEIIHAHPTYAEAFEEACVDALAKS